MVDRGRRVRIDRRSGIEKRTALIGRGEIPAGNCPAGGAPVDRKDLNGVLGGKWPVEGNLGAHDIHGDLAKSRRRTRGSLRRSDPGLAKVEQTRKSGGTGHGGVRESQNQVWGEVSELLVS